MKTQTKVIETLQESQSVLYLLETDLSIQQQERTYIDAVRVVQSLLKSTLEYLSQNK